MKSVVEEIDVVMSVHNGEEHLQIAVDSILSQSHKNLRFLIVEDGSTDGSGKILERSASKDKRIRIIRNFKRLGLTVSLNKALEETSNRYIARMDADDIAAPQRLERQKAFMDNNPHVGAVGSWYHIVDGRGGILRICKPPTNPAAVKRAFLYSAPIAHPAAFLRSATLKLAGCYNAEDFPYSQDRDLFLRILKHTDLGVVPEFLMKLRRSPESISAKQRKEQYRCGRLAVRRAIAAGVYPNWCRIYLARPWISQHMPKAIRVLRDLWHAK